jgi:drug/metabolite transporter (DMT)-like permease
MSKPTTTDYLLLFLQGAIWGSSFQAIKFALEGYGPVSVAAGRIFLGAIIITIYALMRGHSFPRNPRTIILLIIVGAFNCAIPFFLISWGEQNLSTGRTAIFMATGPLLALGIAHFTTSDERLSVFKGVGFLMGFIGVLFVIGLETFNIGLGELMPQMAIICAAFSYAISGAIAKKIENVASSMFTACVLISASLMTLPASLLIEAPYLLETTEVIQNSLYAILYLGLVPTALAFVIRFHLLRKVGYTFVSQVGYLVPMFGVIFGVIIFEEAITISILAGLILILAGIAVSRLTNDSFKRKTL